MHTQGLAFSCHSTGNACLIIDRFRRLLSYKAPLAKAGGAVGRREWVRSGVILSTSQPTGISLTPPDLTHLRSTLRDPRGGKLTG